MAVSLARHFITSNSVRLSDIKTFRRAHLSAQRKQSKEATIPIVSLLLNPISSVAGAKSDSAARKVLPRAAMKEYTNGFYLKERVGATVDSSVPLQELLEAAREAADRGSQVILEAVDKPRNVTYKGATDLVTETDTKTEAAVLAALRERFPNHLLLGEEGGVSGDPDSDYLWCVDPLDGTTNFTHGYPSFATSVAVLYRGKPAAACVVEFSGGKGHWIRRFYTAMAGGGAFSDGIPISVSQNDKLERSLLVTGFGYEHDEAWAANIEMFKHFTDKTRGVRRLGAAAVDLCHVAMGIVEAYWEFRLKPWDVAAGVLIAEEAGAVVTRMDGKPFSVFDRSLLVSTPAMQPHILGVTRPTTEKLEAGGFDFSHWFKPEGYKTS